MTHSIAYNALESRRSSFAIISDVFERVDSEYKSLYIVLLIGIFPSFITYRLCVSYFSRILTISAGVATA